MKKRLNNIIKTLQKKKITNIKKINEGRFSDVFLATKDNQQIAIKVQKKETQEVEESESASPEITNLEIFNDEIKLLSDLKEPGHQNVVKYLEHFTIKVPDETMCIVLNPMQIDLCKTIEEFYEYGMPIDTVKKITKQLLSGIDYIHSKNIIHTDLKPENILVRKGEEKNDVLIQVGDLGNGCWFDKHFTNNIGTTEYRSPESLLNMDYNEKIDVWAVACIVFEVLTGDYLFDPHSYFDSDSDEESESPEGSDDEESDDDYESDEESDDEDDEISEIIDHIQLYLFHQTLGKIPKYISRQGKYFRDFYNPAGNLKKCPIEIEKNKESISDILRYDYNFNEKDAKEIEEFLLPMLEYDQEKRISAEDALKAPWLN